MRVVFCTLALTIMSGCASDPCSGESGSCITAHLRGTAANLDQLSVTVDQPMVTTHNTPVAPIMLPGVMAIVLPRGLTGPVDVRIDGFGGAGLIASDEHVVTLPASGHASQTFTLSSVLESQDMSTSTTADAGDLGPACDGLCPVTAVCGNGVIEPGEVCDDGNTKNGDGCDPTCHFQNVLSRIAGHADGFGFADGAASDARFRSPGALTTDGTTLYVADNCTVRRIANPMGTGTGAGMVTTVAGLANDCQTVDGTGSAARFLNIQDIQWVNQGSAGTIYVATPNALRKLDLASGQVTTSSTSVADPNGLGTDGTLLLLADGTNGIRSMNLGTGVVTSLATVAQINKSCSEITYNAGYYVACNGQLLQLTTGATPTVTAFAGGGTGCSDNAVGTMAGIQTFSQLTSLMGAIYVSDPMCHAIRKISNTGAVTTVAGMLGMSGNVDSPNGTNSTFNAPQGVVALTYLDNLSTELFIADTGNHTVRFEIGGTGIVAGVHPGDKTRTFGADPVLVGPGGIVPVGGIAYLGSSIVFGTSDTATIDLTRGAATDFNSSAAVGGPVLGGVMYGAGADSLIYKVPLDGSAVTLFAGVSGQSTNASMDGPRELAVLHAQGVVTDGTDLYFSDTTNTMRKIDMMSGYVSTLAGVVTAPVPADGVGLNAHFDGIGGLTYAKGTIYFTDGNGSMVRQLVISTIDVTTLAGKFMDFGAVDGPGVMARFGFAAGITTDGEALFITDPGNGFRNSNTLPGDSNGPTVRELVLSTGMVTTMISSRGQWSFRAGVGTQARLNFPIGIVYDPMSKNLLLTDYAEDVLLRIR